MKYLLQDLCCFCLSISFEIFNCGSTKNPDNISHYDKIKTTFSDLANVIEPDSRICKKCSETVDSIYNFNKTCLKNIKILSSYKKNLKKKKITDIYVNLNELHQYKEDVSNESENVKVEPQESYLNDKAMLCDTNTNDIVSENLLKYSNGNVEVRQEIEMSYITFKDVKQDIELNYKNCNEQPETSWINPDVKIHEGFENPNTEDREEETHFLDVPEEKLDKDNDMNIETDVLDLKIEPLSDIDEEMEDDSLNPNNEEILEVSGEATILPDKSKENYIRTYEMFKQWCENKGVRSTTENVLLTYFTEAAQSKKSSTLWSRYSMLRATLHLKEGIDISKCKKLLFFIKQKNKSYLPKQSKVFTEEEIIKFLIEAPDNLYLAMKAVLIIGIAGACRCDELTHLLMENVQVKEDMYVVTIGETKSYSSRKFVIMETLWKNILDEYVKLRPQNMARFFFTVRNGKGVKLNIGHNTIGGIPKKIADFLNLPDSKCYTGHCFRRTSTTLNSTSTKLKKKLPLAF